MGQEGLGVPRVPEGPGGRFHLGGHSPLPRRGVRAGLCPPARAAQQGPDFPVLQGRLWVQGVHPPRLDRPRQAVQAVLPLLGSRASLGPLSVPGAQADPEDQLPHRCHPCLASQVAPGGQGGPEVPLSAPWLPSWPGAARAAAGPGWGLRPWLQSHSERTAAQRRGGQAGGAGGGWTPGPALAAAAQAPHSAGPTWAGGGFRTARRLPAEPARGKKETQWHFLASL